MSTSKNDAVGALQRAIARRQHIAGWSALLVFLSLGALLEFLHGFKYSFYLNPENRLRRQLWTLAHAHGTLLGLIQIGFALGLAHFGRWSAVRLKLVSFFLIDATVLIPLGFFLGGLSPSESDPWMGILLVPFGALLLFIAIAVIIASARLESVEGGTDDSDALQREEPR